MKTRREKSRDRWNEGTFATMQQAKTGTEKYRTGTRVEAVMIDVITMVQLNIYTKSPTRFLGVVS